MLDCKHYLRRVEVEFLRAVNRGLLHSPLQVMPQHPVMESISPAIFPSHGHDCCDGRPTFQDISQMIWNALLRWTVIFRRIELVLSHKERAMLVLSRKKNESIVINNDITIVVVEIRGDKVRLGVEAPRDVPVHRREVYDAIKRNELAKEADAE